MGQFNSKDYDGDPYFDLMRAVPEREIIWWVQKVIWHFGRTYPTLFLHKCPECNGAGNVICPHCKGYKIKQRRATPFSLQSVTKSLPQVTGGSTFMCDHCGDFCDWDEESDWGEKWQAWEKKLAYYDRTYGELFNEWFEDYLNEGNLEEDTPHEQLDPPRSQDTDAIAELEKEVAKEPQKMKALLKRFDGHPYVTNDMLPYKVVDPVKPEQEMLENMGYNRNELPPELHPEAFPEFLLADFNPIARHDQEIRMEALIMGNLDAAMQDAPKPCMFEPAAGTVPCPLCLGSSWSYRFTPNLGKLLRLEQPFWLRTLSRMGPYWDAQPGGGRAGAGAPQRRPYLEFPWQDRGNDMVRALAEAGHSGSYPREGGVRLRKEKEFMDAKLNAKAGDPYWFDSFGTRPIVTASDEPCASIYGANDPLSDDPDKALDSDTLRQDAYHRNPMTGETPLRHRWRYMSSTPAKRFARKVRDERTLDRARGKNEEEQVWKYIKSKDRWAEDVHEPLENEFQSSDILDGGGRFVHDN